MEKRRDRIDMTLRLNSDDVSFSDLLACMDVRISHLHVKGLAMTHEGPAAGRIAKRHYASLANEEGKDARDISEWLKRTCTLITANANLADQIRAGKVDALFWVALLGGYSLPVPDIDPAVIEDVAKLPARILIENYSEMDDDGVPLKRFFPETTMAVNL